MSYPKIRQETTWWVPTWEAWKLAIATKGSEKISCLFNTCPLFDQSVIGGSFKQKVNYSHTLYCQIDKQRE